MRRSHLLSVVLFAGLHASGSFVADASAQEAGAYEVEPDALRRAARSLVVVHCLGSSFGDTGMGFAYRDRSHVLTVSRRGSCRDSLSVTVEGERFVSHRATRDDELGVALLELARPLPESIVPLSAEGFADPERGEPLAYFSYARDRVDYESPFGVGRTSVEAVDPLRFEVNLECEGGPVIDRHGHLLGVCRPRWYGAGSSSPPEGDLVHVDDVEAWLAEGESTAPTRPRITLAMDLPYAISFGRGDVLGVGAVLGITTLIDDRFTLRGELGGHALLHADDPNADPPVGVRLTNGFFLGTRAAFYFEDGPSLALSAELGAVWGYENTPPGPGVSLRTEEIFIHPAARLSVRYGMTVVGYELQLDPVDPARSLHTIQFGFAFE